MAPLLDLGEESRRFAPRLADYAPALKGAAIGTWRARMVNEYSSARVFDGLAAQLAAARFSPELAQTCSGFADEERRHGVLCGAVVVALGGEARAPGLHDDAFPMHEDAPPRARVLRNVIHICCMSETVAVSLIGDEREQMPEGPLRDLLTTIYASRCGRRCRPR